MASGEKTSAPRFSAGARVLTHIWELWASREEVGALAQFVVYNVVLGTLSALDEGGDPELGESGPGWQVVETSGREHLLTGRRLAGLVDAYEAFLPRTSAS